MKVISKKKMGKGKRAEFKSHKETDCVQRLWDVGICGNSGVCFRRDALGETARWSGWGWLMEHIIGAVWSRLQRSHVMKV